MTTAARIATWAILAGVALLSLLPGWAMVPIGRGYPEHFLAYLALSGACALGYGERIGFFRLALVVIGGAGVLEVAQLWAGRTFSAADLLWSVGGALVGIGLARGIGLTARSSQ